MLDYTLVCICANYRVWSRCKALKRRHHAREDALPEPEPTAEESFRETESDQEIIEHVFSRDQGTILPTPDTLVVPSPRPCVRPARSMSRAVVDE
jgi:hypothetical protein